LNRSAESRVSLSAVPTSLVPRSGTSSQYRGVSGRPAWLFPPSSSVQHRKILRDLRIFLDVVICHRYKSACNDVVIDRVARRPSPYHSGIPRRYASNMEIVTAAITPKA
jgi:hypothetical protein